MTFWRDREVLLLSWMDKESDKYKIYSAFYKNA
jgi:hypothetical protein